MTDEAPHPLTFGIYPGSAIGEPGTAGPPDQPDRIILALDQLQGSPARAFAVRAYDPFTDSGDADAPAQPAPADYGRYLGPGRKLDLVAQYHSRSGDIGGYCAFIEQFIDARGKDIATLQVGEEPNITTSPLLDGAYPHVTDALVRGVRTARDKARTSGHSALRVGINTAPLLGPDRAFLADLTRAGGRRFIDDLDYIGLDFFPDVFRPVAPERLGAVVEELLRAHRRENLAAAGLGHLPLVITEHGWPTGPGRSPWRQAEVVRTVLDVIARTAAELNVTGYIHHALRDARTAGTGIFCQFGLMTDDYAPKPAFDVYRAMIGALSG